MSKRAHILQSLTDINRARQLLPIWTDWGVEDCGLTIHSLGLSYLVLSGRDLGYPAVGEMPAPRVGKYGQINADVRSDSIWFDPASHGVELLAEFERYSGKQKDLSSKVENLFLAQHRWGNPDSILVMAYWTEGLVTLPDHAHLRNILNSGYITHLKEEIAGGRGSCLCFLQFVMQRGTDNLLRLSKILIRGE
jgi:hypothetical protein